MNRHTDIDALTNNEVMDLIAQMVDLAADTQDGKLTTQALDISEKLIQRETLTGEKRVLLHYFRANAYENRLAHASQSQAWGWDIPHLRDVLLELRRAVGHSDWPYLDQFRQCQIYTNLGTKLNSIGRPVEALSAWNRALSLNPKFAMALANRGHGLQHYGQALYDDGHFGLFLLGAHDSLSAASAEDAVFDSLENCYLKPLLSQESWPDGL